MKKFSRFTAFVLLAAFLSGFVPATAARAEEDYDPMNTMLALNMAIVSIHKIVSTQDRIVLDQEYNTIINRLALGNIEADDDMVRLYVEQMGFISKKGLRQEEAKRFQERYNRREQRHLVDSLSNIRAYGGSLWSWLGSLATSCVSTYFGYQSAKAELLEGLDDELWQLKKEDVEDCEELQENLLRASWSLLRQYKLPDDYRLTQESLSTLYKAVAEPNSENRLWMLRVLEDKFQVYPPYWFHRAQAAQQRGDGAEARRCFDKFDEVWRPVLRKDPYKVEAAKWRIQDLTRGGNPSDKAEVARQLETMRANTAQEDWGNSLFAGVGFFALGEREKAMDCLRSNVLFGYEKDISEPILKQMQAGKLDPNSLSGELRALVQNIERMERKEKAPLDLNTLDGLKKAAEKGDAEAQFKLGLNYYKGQGVQRDYRQSAEWFRKAAEQGHMFAQNNLGVLYDYGEGVPQDPSKAAEWYRKSAQQGNMNAQHNLAILYREGRGVPQDYSQAVEWYRRAAEQKHVDAQASLGWAYEKGQGVPQTYSKAAEWYRKAAEQGHVRAQYFLGRLYENGRGVPQDYRQAAEWYRKAADKGDSDAQFNLGWLYDTGKGMPQDYRQAAQWYRKAAEQGDASAQNNLGVLYANGHGVPQDYRQAAEWYRKAAEQGDITAQKNLGALYYEGKGVRKDYRQALKWLPKAAEAGDKYAQYLLGNIYFEGGEGVSKNYRLAYIWYYVYLEGNLNRATSGIFEDMIIVAGENIFGYEEDDEGPVNRIKYLEGTGIFRSSKLSDIDSVRAEGQRKLEDIRRRQGQ